jgi:UDP-2,3-diacylglucosamine hydrolase
MAFTIREGALFIADAHYPHHGEEFLKLLQALSRQESVPQLFLMGDIFDLLFGYNKYIRTFSHEAIRLLQRLSKRTDVYYFEGNHDFCLKPIFPDAYLFSYGQQPVIFDFGKKKAALAHGDKFDTSLGYRLYTAWLRNPVTLTMLRPWQRRIIDDRMQKLSQKKICNDYEGFERKVMRIVRHYAKADIVIEGHFHQGCRIGKYISLPSLACQRQIGVARAGDIVFENIERWLT